GLAASLALADVLPEMSLPAGAAVTFAATVGEEGHGDLRGAKHLFEDPAFRPSAFIALDGAGIERVVHRALGSRRLRARFQGPGGHSWAAFGVPNPAHAVGVATSLINEMPLPAQPRAAVSVVRIGGGNGLNTIPQEAWLELDLRAEAEPAVEQLWGGVTQALGRALDIVTRRRAAGTPPLTLHIEPLGHRPSGATDEKHALVQAALAATRSLGYVPALATASTDANVAIARGVPGIALGAGGRGGDTHLPTEWFENTDGPAGILRALLVVLATLES
ncbi:MAG TPA: peptidase M20, partial [Candidatus Rokubacteria bacterium]|nr:peptidase M20 [Candidatus Rokubacteria bacterium]